MNVYTREFGSGSLFQGIAKLVANGVRHRYVRHDAVAEKGRRPLPRTVKELIGKGDVHRLELFAQGADGACRDEALDAEQLHGVDVGAIGNFGGREAMP